MTKMYQQRCDFVDCLFNVVSVICRAFLLVIIGVLMLLVISTIPSILRVLMSVIVKYWECGTLDLANECYAKPDLEKELKSVVRKMCSRGMTVDSIYELLSCNV